MFALSLAYLKYNPNDVATLKAVVEHKGENWDYAF